MNSLNKIITPEFKNKTKQQVGKLAENAMLMSSVIVAGSLGSVAASGGRLTCDVFSDALNVATGTSAEVNFLPKLSERFMKIKQAFSDIWTKMPSKKSKAVIVTTALAGLTVLAKEIYDVIKIQKTKD